MVTLLKSPPVVTTVTKSDDVALPAVGTEVRSVVNIEFPFNVAGPVKFGVAAVKLVKLPTEVKEESTTEEPNEVADKTSAPSTLYVLPEATSKLSSVFKTLAADL
jgi:hypothetical protein